jgi:hypothetical protein
MPVTVEGNSTFKDIFSKWWSSTTKTTGVRVNSGELEVQTSLALQEADVQVKLPLRIEHITDTTIQVTMNEEATPDKSTKKLLDTHGIVSTNTVPTSLSVNEFIKIQKKYVTGFIKNLKEHYIKKCLTELHNEQNYRVVIDDLGTDAGVFLYDATSNTFEYVTYVKNSGHSLYFKTYDDREIRIEKHEFDNERYILSSKPWHYDTSTQRKAIKRTIHTFVREYDNRADILHEQHKFGGHLHAPHYSSISLDNLSKTVMFHYDNTRGLDTWENRETYGTLFYNYLEALRNKTQITHTITNKYRFTTNNAVLHIPKYMMEASNPTRQLFLKENLYGTHRGFGANLYHYEKGTLLSEQFDVGDYYIARELPVYDRVNVGHDDTFYEKSMDRTSCVTKTATSEYTEKPMYKTFLKCHPHIAAKVYYDIETKAYNGSADDYFAYKNINMDDDTNDKYDSLRRACTHIICQYIRWWYDVTDSVRIVLTYNDTGADAVSQTDADTHPTNMLPHPARVVSVHIEIGSAHVGDMDMDELFHNAIYHIVTQKVTQEDLVLYKQYRHIKQQPNISIQGRTKKKLSAYIQNMYADEKNKKKKKKIHDKLHPLIATITEIQYHNNCMKIQFIDDDTEDECWVYTGILTGMYTTARIRYVDVDGDDKFEFTIEGYENPTVAQKHLRTTHNTLRDVYHKVENTVNNHSVQHNDVVHSTGGGVKKIIVRSSNGLPDDNEDFEMNEEDFVENLKTNRSFVTTRYNTVQFTPGFAYRSESVVFPRFNVKEEGAYIKTVVSTVPDVTNNNSMKDIHRVIMAYRYATYDAIDPPTAKFAEYIKQAYLTGKIRFNRDTIRHIHADTLDGHLADTMYRQTTPSHTFTDILTTKTPPVVEAGTADNLLINQEEEQGNPWVRPWPPALRNTPETQPQQ